MKKWMIGLLSLVILAGCGESDEEPTEEVEETQEENEETEPVEEPEEEEDDLMALLEADIPEDQTVRLQRPYWHTRDDYEMEIDLEVGPFIQDEDFAILPIRLSTESEESVSMGRLFDLGVSSGEGIHTQQGYAVRVFDSEALTVSHIAVIDGEAYDSNSQAIQTLTGEGSRNNQLTIDNEREEPVRYFATFARTDSESISLMMENLGVVEDIPVVEREDSGYFTKEELEEAIEEWEDEEGEVDEEEIEQLLEEHDAQARLVPSVLEMLEEELTNSAFESLTEEHGEDYVDYIQARVHPLERYSTGLETSLSRIDEIDHSTLILSSDVLFEFDEADLTDEADEELEAAISELEGVEGGELEIVGHTDNEHTEEYNQELSEDRAASVENRLDELMDLAVFDEVSTRGESFREPIADNDSEEGRAQNRRVELHFTPPTEEVEVVSDDEVPEALGVEVSYPEVAETEYGDIEVESVRRVGDTFVGTIKLSSNEEYGAQYDALTHRPGVGARAMHREDSAHSMQYTAYPITLIQNGRRYYPLDYYLEPLSGSFVEERTEEDGREEYIVPLAERFVWNTSHEDGFIYASFVWPAFDTDEVIIDKQVSFVYNESIDDLRDHDIETEQPWRITNVPVEGEGAMEDTDSEEVNEEESDEDEEDVEDVDEENDAESDEEDEE